MPNLNEKGQCPFCKLKPLSYKRPPRHKFCFRCNRSYNFDTGDQINNWAWVAENGEFVRRKSKATAI